MSTPHARLYELLYTARKVDETLADKVKAGEVPLPIHLSIGQESVSVGVAAALTKKDVVFGTYRGHALYVAMGGNLNKMFAEIYGKATGVARGKGGSMHLIDLSHGIMGMSAIVGTGIANATGYALAMQYLKKPGVVVNFFGDGATEEGVFHESLNFAALKKLPIIYVCENNEYAISSHRSVRQSTESIVARAASYGIPATRIESGDVVEIYDTIRKARASMDRDHSGPLFFECVTYRWRQHLGPNEDFGPGGRDRAEAEAWITNDQVTRIGAQLSQVARKRIEARAEKKIRDAITFAEKSPYPKTRELFNNVLAA